MSDLLTDERRAALREELAQRMLERGTDFYVLLSEAEAADIAAGYVPLSVRGQVRAMLDWRDDDRRRAERPRQMLESPTQTEHATPSLFSDD